MPRLRTLRFSTVFIVAGVLLVGMLTGALSAIAAGEADWLQLHPRVSPPARDGHAMAYDAVRDTLVLFGGQDASGKSLDDMWEWDGSTWNEIKKQPGQSRPSARTGHAMAYDKGRRKILLFGGGTRGTNYPVVRNDTWTWDGKDWKDVTPTNNPVARRWQHAMSYCTYGEFGGVLLFGGADASSKLLGDTWVWVDHKNQWVTLSSLVSPTHRMNQGMTFDDHQGVVVMHGGQSYSALDASAETWAWKGNYSGGAWLKQTPTPGSVFPSRALHALAYYASRNVTVAFGGQDANKVLRNDTWEWNGSSTTWTKITTARSPSAREASAMAYDPRREEIVLFGGHRSMADAPYGDTWVYRLKGTRYVELTGEDEPNCLESNDPCATINYAINRASPGDEIRIGSGEFGILTQPCAFCEEVVLVDKDVSLTGGWNNFFRAQDGMTIIAGSSEDGNQVRGLTVAKGAAAYVQGIRFEFGRARIGGAIYNKGLLVLDDVYVGHAKASYAGGGIFSTADSELRLKNSIIAWNSAPYGGGVFSQGYLTILNASLESNEASENGGAIFQYGSFFQMGESSIHSNEADNGGGLYAEFMEDGSDIPIISIANTTFGGNKADRGGGIYVEYGRVTLNCGTISLNEASVSGGGIYNASGSVSLGNTILAGNRSPTGSDCSGAITSLDYNLIQNRSGCSCTAGSNDIFGKDPKLGGFTGDPEHFPLEPNSPAIDKGNPSPPGSGGVTCPNVDQRGVRRIDHTPCDIGAYEMGGKGGAPRPLLPEDNEIVELLPMFEWSAILGALYHIQVDDNPDFESPEIDESYIGLSSFIPEELPQGTYYWRVKAWGMEGEQTESEWSEPFSFALGVVEEPTGVLPGAFRIDFSATALQLCGEASSHELHVTWEVVGGTPPYEITIEITGPDAVKLVHHTDSPVATKIFELFYPAGGPAAVTVSVLHACGMGSSSKGITLPPC